MNMWGFTGGFMKELVSRFPVFLEKSIPENPLKCEYFLPFVVDELLQTGSSCGNPETERSGTLSAGTVGLTGNF